MVEEIQRLIRIQTVKDVEPEYKFHKQGCSNCDTTLFSNMRRFTKEVRVNRTRSDISVKNAKSLLMYFRIKDNPQPIINKEVTLYLCLLNYF